MSASVCRPRRARIVSWEKLVLSRRRVDVREGAGSVVVDESGAVGGVESGAEGAEEDEQSWEDGDGVNGGDEAVGSTEERLARLELGNEMKLLGGDPGGVHVFEHGTRSATGAALLLVRLPCPCPLLTHVKSNRPSSKSTPSASPFPVPFASPRPVPSRAISALLLLFLTLCTALPLLLPLPLSSLALPCPSLFPRDNNCEAALDNRRGGIASSAETKRFRRSSFASSCDWTSRVHVGSSGSHEEAECEETDGAWSWPYGDVGANVAHGDVGPHCKFPPLTAVEVEVK